MHVPTHDSTNEIRLALKIHTSEFLRIFTFNWTIEQNIRTQIDKNTLKLRTIEADQQKTRYAQLHQLRKAQQLSNEHK